jgi:transcriptional regulator with XRE-family HTH domain
MSRKAKIMKDRIAKIIRDEGMTAAKFAEEIGVQASGISHIISGRNNPSTDFLIKILDRFRGINAEWLLLGKGNMYKSAASPSEYSEKTVKPVVNDLFTAALNNPVTSSAKEKEVLREDKSDISADSVKSEPVKQENSAYLRAEEAKPYYERPVNDKKVEKIVIFFNDNTFESYNPNR